MYSKKAWGGKVEPYIMVKFIDIDRTQTPEGKPATVAVVIWEWEDSYLLGKPADVPVSDVGCISGSPVASAADIRFSASTYVTRIALPPATVKRPRKANGFCKITTRMCLRTTSAPQIGRAHV